MVQLSWEGWGALEGGGVVVRGTDIGFLAPCPPMFSGTSRPLARPPILSLPDPPFPPGCSGRSPSWVGLGKGSVKLGWVELSWVKLGRAGLCRVLYLLVCCHICCIFLFRCVYFVVLCPRVLSWLVLSAVLSV